MRRKPLVVLAPFAALCLWATLGLGTAKADETPSDSRRLAEVHAQLRTQLTSLAGLIEGFKADPRPADLRERLSKLLQALPPELDDYRTLRARLKEPDTANLADKIQEGIKKAEDLQAEYWKIDTDPSAAERFPMEIKDLRGQLAGLLGDSERRLPKLAAQAGAVVVPPDAERAAPGPRAGLKSGSSLLNCANSFDGKGCGGGALAGPANGALGSLNPGAPGTPGTSGARGTTGQAAKKIAAASAPSTANDATRTAGPKAVVSGAAAHLDHAAVPPPVSVPAKAPSAQPGANGSAVSAAPTAPAAPPLSPASQSCISTVNGPNAADPQHPSLAEMCKTSPTLSPILAGLLDSVKEQFGTVSGIVSNIVFLILGLLMSVATGGVGLILKLLALIGAGYAIWKLISGLISAFSASRSAPEGSPERAAALKTIGMLGGSLLIMITMALVGFGAGKTKPGAAAVRSMEGGLTAAMDKIGLTSAMDGLNSKIPAPALALLEKIMGKAPERPNAAVEEKPIVPPGEDPLAGAVPEVAAVARASGLTAQIAGKINDETRMAVADEMRMILRESLADSPAPGKVSGKQFNAMLGRLVEFAENSKSASAEGGIKVTRSPGLKGVYPKGLDQIKYKGFGFMTDEAAEVSGAKLHELAHLFHTIQMRATLIRSGVPEASAVKFLAMMEDGTNYNNLEYYATQIGKPMPGGTTLGHFSGLAGQLIDATETGMRIAEIRLPNGVPIEKGYAYWATRIVPRLLGKSPAEAAVRMTFYTFIGYYIVNLDMNSIYSFDRKTLDELGVPKGKSGLRDIVDAAILHAPKSLGMIASK